MIELIEKFQKCSTLDLNDVERYYKVNKYVKFMEAKHNNPSLKQKRICERIGTSDSTIKRIRKDLNITSPYRSTTTHKARSNTIALETNPVLYENNLKLIDNRKKNS